HFGHRRALVEQRAGRTGHDAFAARRAGFGITPRLVEIADDVGFGAAAGDVLGAGAFDVPADAHTTGAENAPVVIHAEAQMGVVHTPFRKAIIVTHVVHALAVGERLEFAMAVGHARGADVIALGEQQLQRHAAVFLQPFAVGPDLHAFGDFGRAGGQELGDARDFHETEAAGADVVHAFQMAQGGDFDPGVGGH